MVTVHDHLATRKLPLAIELHEIVLVDPDAEQHEVVPDPGGMPGRGSDPRNPRLLSTTPAQAGLVVAKAILDLLGVEAGPARPPRRPADDTVMRRAALIIEEFGVLL